MTTARTKTVKAKAPCKAAVAKHDYYKRYTADFCETMDALVGYTNHGLALLASRQPDHLSALQDCQIEALAAAMALEPSPDADWEGFALSSALECVTAAMRELASADVAKTLRRAKAARGASEAEWTAGLAAYRSCEGDTAAKAKAGGNAVNDMRRAEGGPIMISFDVFGDAEARFAIMLEAA